MTFVVDTVAHNFYNIEDTLQINTIIKNENIRQLIPNNIKFLWSVKPLTSITDANGQVTDIDGEVIELFVIRTSREEGRHL